MLLLKRRSKNNDKAWDAPGGQLDNSDSSVYEGACREGREEMGSIPAHDVVGEYSIQRAQGAKQYTMFVCVVDPAVAATFQPVLSKEHREAKWMSLEEARSKLLHPWMLKLQKQHPGVLEGWLM